VPISSIRLSDRLHIGHTLESIAFKTIHTQRPKEHLQGKPACTARSRLDVTAAQKMPHPLFHITAHNATKPGDGAVPEVVVPSSQLRIEEVGKREIACKLEAGIKGQNVRATSG